LTALAGAQRVVIIGQEPFAEIDEIDAFELLDRDAYALALVHWPFGNDGVVDHCPTPLVSASVVDDTVCSCWNDRSARR
jgi:hypothetical protein